MKIALCFFISYDHVLSHETIWKEWIHDNRDIVHVYFHYTDRSKIQSEWILRHCLPANYVVNTSYYHMMDAYMAISKYAYHDDPRNQWFCYLTDSCVPLVSPEEFRFMFFKHAHQTVMSWRQAWWNIHFHKRANLKHLPPAFHLGNAPWFVMTRQHIQLFLQFCKQPMYHVISQGGLANESVFAIMFQSYRLLPSVVNRDTTLVNWDRPTSATSPYVFHKGDAYEINFIHTHLKQNPYLLFMRKVRSDFPVDALERLVHNNKNNGYRRWCLFWGCVYYQHRTLGFMWLLSICFVAFLVFDSYDRTTNGARAMGYM